MPLNAEETSKSSTNTSNPQSIFRYHFLPAALTALVTSPARFMMNNSVEYRSVFGAFGKFPTHSYGFKAAPLNTLRGGSALGIQCYVKEAMLPHFQNPSSAKAQFISLFIAVLASTPVTALFEAPYIRRTNEAYPEQVKYPKFSNYVKGTLLNTGTQPLFRYPFLAASSLFIRDLKFAYNNHYGKDLPFSVFLPSMVALATFSGFFHNIALRCIKEDLNLPEQGSQPHFKKDGGFFKTLKKIGYGDYTHPTCKVPFAKDAQGKMGPLNLTLNILSVCCNTNMVIWRTVFFASFYSAHQLSKWAVSEKAGKDVARFFSRGPVNGKPELEEDQNERIFRNMTGWL